MQYISLLINKCLEKGCSFVELFLIEYSNIEIGYEYKDKITKNIYDNVLVLNVYFENKWGSIVISCNTIEPNFPVEKIVNLAINSAILSKEMEMDKFGNKSVFHNCKCNSWIYKKQKDININEYFGWLNTEYNKIKGNYNCSFLSFIYSYEIESILYVNSNNIYKKYKTKSSKLCGLLEQNNPMVKLPLAINLNNILPGSNICDILDKSNFKSKIDLLNNDIIINLSGTVKLSRYAVFQLINMLIQALKGDTIASGKSFIKKSYIGNQLFGNNFNLIDDPMAKSSNKKILFDIEGNIGKKRYLIKNGKVENILGGLYLYRIFKNHCWGNSFRKFPDYSIKILETNLLLEINGEVKHEYNFYIQEMNINCIFDISTGNIKGFGFGYKYNEQKPMLFLIESNIKNIFSSIIKATEPSWVNTVFTPELIITL